MTAARGLLSNRTIQDRKAFLDKRFQTCFQENRGAGKSTCDKKLAKRTPRKLALFFFLVYEFLGAIDCFFCYEAWFAELVAQLLRLASWKRNLMCTHGQYAIFA